MKTKSDIINKIINYSVVVIIELYLLYIDARGFLIGNLTNEQLFYSIILIPVVIQTFRVMFKKLNKINNNNSTDLIEIKKYFNFN